MPPLLSHATEASEVTKAPTAKQVRDSLLVKSGNIGSENDPDPTEAEIATGPEPKEVDLKTLKGFKRAIAGLMTIYKINLEAEKLTPPEVKIKLVNYEQHLRELAMQYQLGELPDTPEQTMHTLAELVKMSYVQTLIAAKNGDIKLARQHAAITMRLITEAYIQAGASDGSRGNRMQLAKGAFFVSGMAALSASVGALALPHPAAFWASGAAVTTYFASQVSGIINEHRLRNFMLGYEPKGTEQDALVPTPLKGLVKSVDQRRYATGLIGVFWKTISVKFFLEEFRYSVKGRLPFNRYMHLSSWQLLNPFGANYTKFNDESLKALTDHLVEISDQPLSSLVGMYRHSAQSLTSCDSLNDL